MAPESRRLNGVGRSRTGASSVNDRLKALSDRSGESSAGGSRFHVAGPLTAKLRCPVAVRARETSRVPVGADRRC